MEKFKNTNIKRYGVEYPLQNENIQNKQKNTNIKRYGVEYVSLNADIRKKQTLTKIKNLLIKYSIEDKDWKRARKLLSYYFSRQFQASPRKITELYQINFLYLGDE